MIVGIVGVPKSGKTTVFNAVTGENCPVGTYSATGTTNTATVWVPDERMNSLRAVYSPKKFTPASFQFRDYCVVTGDGVANEMTAKLLSVVRDADALLKVVRGFQQIGAPEANPLAELKEIDNEFLFADLEIIERRIEKLEKSTKKPHPDVDKEKKELELLTVCRTQLMAERPLSELTFKPDEEKLLRGFKFLTQKPCLVLLNLDDDADPSQAKTHYPELFEAVGSVIVLRGRIEMEIAQLPAEDKPVFMEEMGVSELLAERVIRECFKLLGLICFFTVGPDEVKAWTLFSGESVLSAAGAIHTDLAKGFIKAEVANYADLAPVEYNFKKARGANLSRLEGRDYIVKDGDIIEIRFNV
ncbi:MAG: redox-regulated ATPase YchF [Planctomycetota bacterium]